MSADRGAARPVEVVRGVGRWLLALFFVAAGVNHFRSPAIYLGMMPAWLPWPEGMNAISGAAEVAGGVGLVWRWHWPWARERTQRAAAWGLIALLVAIFPANLHVAMQGHMPGMTFSPTVLWARLPFQAAFMAAVWWVALAKPSAR